MKPKITQKGNYPGVLDLPTPEPIPYPEKKEDDAE